MTESTASSAPRLWGGRFASGPSVEMDRLNRSLPIDKRLWREDVAGSRAWATALGAAGVLSPEETEAIRSGLDQVATRLSAWKRSDWEEAPDEDIHSLVERLLGEEVGAVAGKLHTGRSRNDQVATDSRMWSRSALLRLDHLLRDLQRALISQAELHLETVMPSYTHLQRAQPVSAAHWLLSHAWPLARDRERLAESCDRVSALPLGSGAIAGCPFPVDRILLQELLGFRHLSQNSMDAVGDRDWMAEILFATSMVGIHLSRLGEDLILFGSSEFGFLRLSDQFSTGSSLMPQKRNPDAMELARGKCGRLVGNLTAALTLLKGLPTGYNKDLQEDKELLFDAFDTLETLLPAVIGSVASMEISVERCAAAVDSGMLATDLADHLVRSGVPFRQAHETVGRLVRAAEEQGCGLDELSEQTVAHISPMLANADLSSIFDPVASLHRRSMTGGTAPSAVREQLRALQTRC
ncbi:argininosuccinate lyase [soil metagenome]